MLVSLLWLILLVLKYLGGNVSEYLLGLLMGGSAVGISYVLAKRIPKVRDKTWKFVAIPIAFLTAYFLNRFNFFLSIFFAITYIVSYYFFRTTKESLAAKKIEHELENCC